MPRGGIRPRRIDGSTDHLLKPKWKQGKTRTIRVPVVLAEQLLKVAHRLDDGESIDLTQDNRPEENGGLVDLTQDNRPEGDGKSVDMTQDKKVSLDRLKANQAQAIALLQNAITPRAQGGSYAANNATGMRKLVEQALALLAGDE